MNISDWIDKQIDIIYLHQLKKIKKLIICKEWQSEMLKEANSFMNTPIKFNRLLKFRGIEIVDAPENIMFDWAYDE